MARRSATNERYQKYTSPSGKTRKSAAAAKPKRATGAAPVSGKGKTKPSASSSSSTKSGPWSPQTLEYKRLRKLWWWLLGAALVLTTASWAVRTYTQLPVLVSSMMLGAAYASIFTALYIDWTKMRKMRNEWIKAGRPVTASADKPKKAEKSQSTAGDDDAGDTQGTSTT